MEKAKKYVKNITQKKYLPFWLFGIVQALYHSMMREGPGADAMWFFRNQLAAYSLKDYLIMRYETWTSRLVIEGILVYVAEHVTLWKLLDWCMWMLFFVSISYLFHGEEKRTTKNNWMLAGLILLYPLSDLTAAGWIATTTNYIWPLALGMFAMTGIVDVFLHKKTPVWRLLLFIPAMLYAANAEQMCAVLFGIYTLCMLYLFFTKRSVKDWWQLFIGWGICILELLFIMTCPGNDARAYAEIKNSMPAFVNYNLIDKAEFGLQDTMYHLLTSGNLLFLVFAVLVSVLVFLKTKEYWLRLVSILPVVFTVVFTFFWDAFDHVLPKLASVMESNEIVNAANYELAYSYLPIVIYLGVLLCELVSLAAIAENFSELFSYAGLLGIGLASSVVIGFSPTFCLDQRRTYLCLYVAMLVVTAALADRNREIIEGQKNVMQVLHIAFSGILVFAVLGGFMAASAI